MTRFEADEGALAATEAADAAAFSGTVEWQGILATTEAADTPLRRRRRRQLRMRVQGGLLSMDEAAAKLGCSIKTLNGHVASGALRYVNIGHGTKRSRKMFTDADLNEFIAHQTRKDIPCPSTAPRARRTGTTTSGSVVIDFTAPRKPPTGAKRKK